MAIETLAFSTEVVAAFNRRAAARLVRQITDALAESEAGQLATEVKAISEFTQEMSPEVEAAAAEVVARIRRMVAGPA